MIIGNCYLSKEYVKNVISIRKSEMEDRKLKSHNPDIFINFFEITFSKYPKMTIEVSGMEANIQKEFDAIKVKLKTDVELENSFFNIENLKNSILYIKSNDFESDNEGKYQIKIVFGDYNMSKCLSYKNKDKRNEDFGKLKILINEKD